MRWIFLTEFRFRSKCSIFRANLVCRLRLSR